MNDNIFLFSVRSTVFKSLTDAVRESEIRKTDTSTVLTENKNS